MVSAVGSQQDRKIDKGYGYYTTPKIQKELLDAEPHLISGNPIQKVRVMSDSLVNAAVIYPLKGMSGDKNSNFYEFLTMGMIPYLVGSGMLIAVFNAANKYFEPNQAKHASVLGRKMALGVLFYGILKSLSKKFIEVPVHLKTGVNVNIPYKHMKAQLPTKPEDAIPDSNGNPKEPDKSNEYHKVFESVDFPYWDLLYDIKENKPRNYYYDRVAKKMGLGENLVDSDQEVKPKIKELLIRTRTWTTITSYIWAGLGVALACQEGWNNAFSKPIGEIDIFSGKFFGDLKNSFKTSCRQLWEGGVNKSKNKAIAGKIYVTTAIASTVAGILMSTFDFFGKKSDNKNSKIDYKKDYTVG